MAQSNFRALTFPEVASIDKYVSKAGHDSNSGSANEPKKTIPLGNSLGVQIGAGEYESQGSSSSLVYYLIGDGRVVIKNSQFVGNTITAHRFRNLSFDTCIFNASTINGVNNRGFVNCVLKNCTNIIEYNTAKTVPSQYVVCINCTWNVSHGGNDQYFILYNTTMYEATFFKDSYIDINSIIIYSGAPTAFRKNNVQGLITLGVKSYAIQDQFVGTPQANGYGVGINWLTEAQLTTDGYAGTISGWNTAVASCINRNPKFSDVAGEDFTLQADSPHIRAAENGIDNIGGTKVAVSIINTDNNGATIDVIPSSQIDTAIPLSYKLNTGQTEGTIDYVIDLGGVAPLDFIDLKAELKFNSDFSGGSTQNKDVPDSEPLTSNYARKTNTTLTASPDLNKLKVATGLITVGQYVRVLGQIRLVTAIAVASPNDTVTVASNFLAVIGAGVVVTYGTEEQLSALNPNRLTYQLRTSVQSVKPTTNAEWDNDLNPAYGQAGTFFTHEWGSRPVYGISGGVVYGGGESALPLGATIQEIDARWIHVRVYLRNNYSSNGI